MTNLLNQYPYLLSCCSTAHLCLGNRSDNSLINCRIKPTAQCTTHQPSMPDSSLPPVPTIHQPLSLPQVFIFPFFCHTVSYACMALPPFSIWHIHPLISNFYLIYTFPWEVSLILVHMLCNCLIFMCLFSLKLDFTTWKKVIFYSSVYLHI